MPNPLIERSSEVSTCMNMSKMRGSWSAAMPMPLSRTRMTACSPSRSTVERNATALVGSIIRRLTRYRLGRGLDVTSN